MGTITVTQKLLILNHATQLQCSNEMYAQTRINSTEHFMNHIHAHSFCNIKKMKL